MPASTRILRWCDTRGLGQTNRVGQLADARLHVRMGSDEPDQPEPRRISQRLEPDGQSIRLYWLNDLAYDR
jgi:hypothetical protein